MIPCSLSTKKNIKYVYTTGGFTEFGAIAVVRNFLSAVECQQVIDICERCGFSAGDSNDSYEQTTVDIEVDACIPLRQWFLDRHFIADIQRYLLSIYGVPITAFDDVFVVKYDAACQRELVRHCDGGHVSFMVTLSAPDTYEGGGTHFDVLDEVTGETSALSSQEALYRNQKHRGHGYTVGEDGVVRLGQGDLIVFNAAFYHSGRPISAGVRYLLVGFCFVDNDAAAQEGNISLSLEKV